MNPATPIYGHQRGAVTLEMTLVFLPFIVFWLLGFDFGLTLFEMTNFRKAHYAAGRAGSMQRSTDHIVCEDAAKAELNQKLSSMGLGRPVDFAGSGTSTVNGRRGFDLRVAIPTRCISCFVFQGLREITTYRAGTFYPYEDQNACTN